MGFNPGVVALACIMVILPAALCCLPPPVPFKPSRAAFYGDGYGTSHGACGYGKDGSKFYNGSVATLSGRLFKQGAGCGACYQVKCKNKYLCSNSGAIVVATDYGEGDRTDFILSRIAFGKLGNSPYASKQLFKYGVVDVEYARVPCHYPASNIMIKVTEQARFPDYLSLTLLSVDGKNDITAVQVLESDMKTWRPLRRAYGAVWDTPNPPHGKLYIKFQTNGLRYTKAVHPIPNYWKPGVSYDSGVQLYYYKGMRCDEN